MADTSDLQRRAKAEAFLSIVQTGLLAIAGAKRRADLSRKQIAEYSGTGVFMHMDEAVRAAGMIPDAMSVSKAAAEFCGFYAADRDGPRNLPHWFARYRGETHDYTAVAKADQFVWIVQTSLIANAENRAVHEPSGNGEPAATQEAMAEAMRVASQIPGRIDSTEAASEFLAFYAPGMRERRTPPKWCVAAV